MPNAFQVVKKKPRKRKFEKSTKELICESQEFIKKKLKEASKEFESSQYYFELLQSLDNCLSSLDSNSIQEILCYGIGNFLENKTSLHQLAALLKISEKYNSTVTIYDPILSSIEIKTLTELNFKVLSENEEGKRKIHNQLTLVFLPHCPKQLTNNFLWANWNNSIFNCILIANSFSKIIQDNTEKVLQESANYLLKIHPKTQEIPLNDCYHIESVFNNLSIHYFDSKNFDESFFTQTLEKEPDYLADTEFITKNLNNLILQNE